MFVFRETVKDHVTYRVAGISWKGLSSYREDTLSSRFVQYSRSARGRTVFMENR